MIRTALFWASRFVLELIIVTVVMALMLGGFLGLAALGRGM